MSRGTGVSFRLPGIVLLALALVVGLSPPAVASHETQIQPDITKLKYQPIGHFGPGEALPAANAFETALKPLMSGLRFNPSGNYNAFDTNVFETLALPYRAAGDPSTSDPYGNGGNPEHGRCGTDPGSDRRARRGVFVDIAGACPNHQLEYLAYYEATMKDILGDFGVTLKRYPFNNPGSSDTQPGDAFNVAAVVPGAEHPDETVLVSGHFDQTDDGPASAWDSGEGHAQVIRVAKLMADYWKATGTRPAVTVKFIPWDAEESGTLGSADYADNNVVPGEAFKVRSYWNTDPCAGGYPAFRFGNPADRVDLGIQLANIHPEDDPLPGDDTNPPADAEERFARFNAKAPLLVEQVFDHLDDTLTLAPGVKRDIFVSTAEGTTNPFGGDIGPGKDVVIGTSRSIGFQSDWRNFERIGVPFFNPGPEITGPDSQGELGNPDGIAILHNPTDNLQTLNAYSGGPKDGNEFSEGWIKGMEMCAHLLGWGMLQPEHAGATPVNGKAVAYYEALPNEADRGKPVTFDASGSHRNLRGKAVTGGLEYFWEFGDGRKAQGRVVAHSYARKGVYQSKLTVRAGGRQDTMRIPITVLRPQAAPRLDPLPAEDSDGDFTLEWTFNAFDVSTYSIDQGTGIQTLFTDGAESLDKWTVEQPTPTHSKIKPWQASDSSTSKVRGNLRRGGQRSLWTGIAIEDQEPGVGPGEGVSSLTLNDAIDLPEGRSTILSYWSDFANDANDFARVEVAADDGSGESLAWETVDSFGRNSADGYLLTFQETATEGGPNFERRTVDLTAFAGERVRLRFSYVLGASQFVNVWRTGWYIDDISVVSADFAELGRTQEATATKPTPTTFNVVDRAPGDYLYRVRAVFKDNSTSGASNIEQIHVTG